MPTLRPYQGEVYRQLCESAGKQESPLVALTTGAGKTVIGSAVARGTHAKGNRSLWLVHRRELVTQAVEHMHAQGLEAGVIMAGETARPGAPVQVASIQTLIRRELPEDIQVLQYDEAHHSLADSSVKLLGKLRQRVRFVCGYTATPCRTNGGSLRPAGWTQILEGPSTSSLIEQSYLAGFDYYAPSDVDMSGVKVSAGDYQKRAAEGRMRPLTGKAVEHYKRYLDGRRSLVFAVTVAHSEQLAASFLEAGIPAIHCDAKTPKADRDEAIQRFRQGEILVFSSVGLVDEGFDLPECDGAIMARPTKSLVFHRQACGRTLRPKEGGRRAVIIDMAGNVERLGLPDEPVAWSLDGKAASSEKKPYRICPACRAVVPVGQATCPLCGHEAAKGEGRRIRTREGDMRKVGGSPRVRATARVCTQTHAYDYYSMLLRARGNGFKLKAASVEFVRKFHWWPVGYELRRLERKAMEGCPHLRYEGGRCRFCGMTKTW